MVSGVAQYAGCTWTYQLDLGTLLQYARKCIPIMPVRKIGFLTAVVTKIKRFSVALCSYVLYQNFRPDRCSTVILRLTKIIRSRITFVIRNLR